MPEKKTDPIAKIDSTLSEYEEALSGELKELKQSERDVKEKLRQVKAMRRAGGTTEGEKPTLPAPKKAEVIQIVASVLEAGPLTEDDLKHKVAGELRVNHTLTGLPLRMKEALGTDLFETDSSGLVRLAKPASQSSKETES